MKRNSNGISARVLVMAVALTLIIGGIIGGSVAWLTAKTETVVNTFTVGNISIELGENKPDNKQAKIIPGVNIEKDPKVTVKANSEACWLFVKVDETNWPSFVGEDGVRKVSYAIAEGWTKLSDGVYYREVDATTTDVSYYVLANNVVTVSDKLTKAELNTVTEQPTLGFTAYAIQKESFATPDLAWEEASK